MAKLRLVIPKLISGATPAQPLDCQVFAKVALVTTRKRSLGQGNRPIFTRVCHSVHSRGMCGCGCVCVVAGGACVVAGGSMCGCRGACMVAGGCAWLWGVCVVAGGCAWLRRERAWLPGGCIGYDQIRSMSGRYASYWNAFLSYYDTSFCVVEFDDSYPRHVDEQGENSRHHGEHQPRAVLPADP